MEDQQIEAVRREVEKVKLQEARIHTLPEHKTMERHFEHLNVTKRWGDD